MKLSTKITYGVRALFDIAYHSCGIPAKVNDIARRQGISARYIEQIFIMFKKADIIKTVRGPKGGYMLAKKPEEISLGEIIRSIEGDIELVSCKPSRVGEGECSMSENCVTAPIWSDLNGKVSSFFDSISLKDLCDRGKSLGITRDMEGKFIYHI
ncbi:MAG: Rrf2 family transcriptional regulator [bacterium]|nr:Rrf2 family transcriptional regulator [bacterium]